MGKLISPDSFNPPVIWEKPPRTEAADVEENIVLWVKNNPNNLELFCRPDETRPNGYRFIRATDLTQTETREKLIKKKVVTFTFVRKYYTTDHFCPLWFTNWHDCVTYEVNGVLRTYVSDAELRRYIDNL